MTPSLAARLTVLARDLQHQDDTGDVLAGIVAAAVAVIPGTDSASISVAEGRARVQSRAASDELIRLVDTTQTVTGQGPCLDALHTHRVVSVPDLATEVRWPEFTRRAVALGAGSMLCFQLWVDGADLGALNLVSRTPAAFGEESEQVGEMVAAHAAVAFAAAEEKAQLLVGLAGRDIIGQAKGMVMERFGVGAEEAFALLLRLSSETNTKLRVVATDLVDAESRPDPEPVPEPVP